MSRLRPIEWLLAFFALVAVLCDADQCLGQTAKIDGPKESALGDLVVLDASQSDASDFAWRLVNSTKTFLPVEAGRKVVFSSGTPGKYSFVLAVAKADKVALAQHDVTIGQPEPLPPSPPNPPTPTPLPPGRYGLAPLARAWAPSTAPRLSVNAQALASSFRAVASAIAAGTLNDGPSILAETKQSNQTALGQDSSAWLAWFTNLKAKLDQHIKANGGDGSLATPADFREAWGEIATGLESIK